MSASSAASWSSPSIAIVAPWSAATARSVSAKATSGWNAPIWVPAAIAGARTSAPSAPLVWIIAWPLYIRSEPASGATTSSGTARMMSSTSSRIGSGSAKTRVTSTSERNRSRRPGSRLATAWTGQPAARQRDAERRPDRARADDPDDRRLARRASGRAGGRGRPAWSSSPWRCEPGGAGSRSMPAASMAAASVVLRSRSGSSPGSRPGLIGRSVIASRAHPSSVRAARRRAPASRRILRGFDPGRAHPSGAD